MSSKITMKIPMMPRWLMFPKTVTIAIIQPQVKSSLIRFLWNEYQQQLLISRREQASSHITPSLKFNASFFIHNYYSVENLRSYLHQQAQCLSIFCTNRLLTLTKTICKENNFPNGFFCYFNLFIYMEIVYHIIQHLLPSCPHPMQDCHSLIFHQDRLSLM